MFSQLKQNRTYSCFSKDNWENFKRFYKNEIINIPQESFFEEDGNVYLDIEYLKQNSLINGNSHIWMDILKHSIVKPENCLFAFGIPTGDHLNTMIYSELKKIKSDYLHNHENPEKKTLNYGKTLLLLHPFIRFLKKLKVTIAENITKKDMASFFKKNYQVIFLLTHYIGNYNEMYNTGENCGIELGEQFVSVEELTNMIPKEFSNTLDMCICNPRTVGISLRINRQNCSIRYLERQAEPKHWLIFYRFMFEVFKRKNLSYRDAALLTEKYIASHKSNNI